ncbi:sodium:proton antiporter [Candidatus Poriferisocius sp.]|uniref:sodium:proton antiporter n=1 Tax=Candidatus Poriferisocius sp. TaxID=3101276 RepID=UPI003B01BB3B
MRKVLIYSVLLLAGLALSQVLPQIFGGVHDQAATTIRVLTMTGLAFIMIHVGFEFHIDKTNLRQYGWDYFVAFTAASFPWIFVTSYFVFVMLPADLWGDADAWKETLLAGRFAAPTSAGVLFSMLAAAGLGATWLFRKARILAIFDDLDTVLLMIPLQILLVGLAWQLGLVVVLMAVLLSIAYIFLHRVTLPVTWGWVLFYAAAIVGISELLYELTKVIDPSVPIHIEVLLPAFVLGCIARPSTRTRAGATSSPDAVAQDGGEAVAVDPGTASSPPSPDTSAQVEADLHKLLERPTEIRAAAWVAATFMLLVGLSLPQIFEGDDAQHLEPVAASLHAAAPAASVDDPTRLGGDYEGRYTATVTASQPQMSWGEILMHVLLLSALSNLGKMFPALCYRSQAHWRERLAVAIGMWPRGEVGAGVLVLSLSYGIGGPIVTVAMLSLALNLALTGVFILIVKKLIAPVSVELQPAHRA